MDDFVRDCAVELDKPQLVVEREYYLVDLPAIIEARRQRQAIGRLEELHAMLAAAGRMEKDDYKAFVTELQRQTGYRPEAAKFDRDKFEQLRALTRNGGNKAK